MGKIIPYTCPNIDKIIKRINAAMKLLREAEKIEDDGIKDYIDDAFEELDGLEDELEDIRKSNSSLRELWESEEEKVKLFTEHLEVFKNAIAEI